MFDESYYATANYSNYLWKADRYRHLARDLADLFEKIGVWQGVDRLLDFGCGPGFLVQGFQQLGKQASGCDISPWSVRYGSEELGIPFLRLPNEVDWSTRWSVVTALDVLEHMTDEDIATFCANVDAELLVVRIPLAECDGGGFVLPVSESDPTHINRKTAASWEALLERLGWERWLVLNLSTIWESNGVLSRVYRKRS
ncbi:MAG: methyltransferase domain-containing protein [Planctomycetes bacterium]|nr:methyltransferase domain-containing protein [Planctomycetota bacterium]